MLAVREKEMKNYLHDVGHMTKMAAIYTYLVKTLYRSSSPEPVGRFQRNLVVALGAQTHHSLFK